MICTVNCIGNQKNCLYPNKSVDTSEDELKEAVKYDHVCAEYKNNYRSADNFLKANVIVMECDNDQTENPDEWITPEVLDELMADVSYALASSRHNMLSKDGKAARPKFHVYFFSTLTTTTVKPLISMVFFKTLKVYQIRSFS